LLKRALKERKEGKIQELGTLLDYLSSNTIFVFCEPYQLGERAEEYSNQVLPGDPFFITWGDFREQAAAKRMTLLNVAEISDSNSISGAQDSSSLMPLPAERE